jgi:aspartate/tyrosine/aromatic aminotransferase
MEILVGEFQGRCATTCFAVCSRQNGLAQRPRSAARDPQQPEHRSTARAVSLLSTRDAPAAAELIVATSCSKNFGLYRERTGAIVLMSDGAHRAQVKALREEHAIYMVNSSRINVAGASHDNVDRLCDAVMSVL